jgi:hypothetical protein
MYFLSTTPIWPVRAVDFQRVLSGVFRGTFVTRGLAADGANGAGGSFNNPSLACLVVLVKGSVL